MPKVKISILRPLQEFDYSIDNSDFVNGSLQGLTNLAV